MKYLQITDVNNLIVLAQDPKLNNSTIFKALTKALHLSAVTQIEQLKEGEKPSRDKRKAVMRSHGFRKFVNTTMINHCDDKKQTARALSSARQIVFETANRRLAARIFEGVRCAYDNKRRKQAKEKGSRANNKN